jgi:hypothetical protein
LTDTITAGAKKIGNATVSAGKAGGALLTGGTNGLARHNQSVADQKVRDTAVLAKWTPMGDPVKRQILKNAVDDIDPSVLGPLLLGNPATKDPFETCVEKYAPIATMPL